MIGQFKLVYDIEHRAGSVLEVNGKDLKDCVRAVDVCIRPKEVPLVTLHVMTRQNLDVMALITTVVHDAPQILDMLDDQEIEDEATGRLGWGDEGTLASKVLEVIKEKVRGIATSGSDQGVRGPDDAPGDDSSPWS